MTDRRGTPETPVTGLPHELNVGPAGVGLTEPHGEPASPPSRLHLYVAVLTLAPFLYLAVCFFLLRSTAFFHHTQNAYVANMGYGLTLHNADCDVLIYGDSSAMVGVDPSTVKGLTHRSVCNIADFAGMMRLNDTMVLDTFLASNPRPRDLVILLGPEDLGPTWRSDGNFEAVMMRVRQSPDRQFLHMLWRHPEDILSAIGLAGRYAVTWLVHKPLSPAVWRERELTQGRFPDEQPALQACPAETRVTPPDRNWLEALRTRYSVGGTRVFIDVTPVPTCDPALPIYQRQLPAAAGLLDNQLHTYPVSWYSTSGRLHLRPEGRLALSTEVAAQITRAEEKH